MRILHLRLRGETVAALKRRAGLAGVEPADYVELVLWYVSLQWADRESDGSHRLAAADDLYFAAPLPTPLRERMIARSTARARNLAVYAGALVEDYFRQFERDPADLRLLARLSELLERRPIPAEQELLEVLRLVAGSPVSRMPEPYQARWLHQRFTPFLHRIEANGAPAELTVERLGTLLAQLKPGLD